VAEIYRFSGLELDTSRFQVRRAGKVLAVQPQVFDLLHYLVANHDRIVPRDELFAKIWSGRLVSEATLSSRIKAVRQLIGDNGRQQSQLLTLRHRGFRYVGPVEVELPGTQRIASAVTAAVRSTQLDPPTSIAVLPFELPGEDAARAYLGEGIAADIIGLLARHQWLTVISRNSTFAIDRRATPRQIGTLLSVGYVLTGRILWQEGRGRIDAELADCDSARLLWTQSYHFQDTGVHNVIEEIAQQIAATIEPRLGQIERQRSERKRPEDFHAWDCCHQAFWHLYRFTPEDLAEAKDWFRKALAFDPGLARARSGLAYAALQLAFYGPVSQRDLELQLALGESRAAVALEPQDAFNRFALGRSLCLLRRYPEAQVELEAALEANRSFAQAWFALAFCYTVWDKPAAALPLYEKAVRLSPQDPHLWAFHHMRGLALFRLDRLEEAEDFVRAALRQQHSTWWPLATLCALLGARSRIDDARAVADRLSQLRPGFDLAHARAEFFFLEDRAFVERYVGNLALAGIT
jgi:TolB-like protein/Tfp pilus assembly protein PilF